MRRAVLYARVSSLKQEDGYSIPAQLDLLRVHAKNNALQIVEEFTDVESAKEPGRKNFSCMMKMVRKDPALVILVEKSDRLYRSMRDYAEFEDLRVEVHFVKEGVVLRPDSHSSERFKQGIMALMARNYIENLAEETRKGMTKKAESGIFPSVAPLGYLNQEKRVVPDPFRREFIRQCFLWRADGMPVDEVRKRAEHSGLRSRKGCIVSLSQMHKILSDPIYYGAFRWRGKLYAGTHDPIVDKSTWDLAQYPRGAHLQKREFAFRGLIRCAGCGHLYTAELQKGHRYYHCANRRNPCRGTWLREDRLIVLMRRVVEAIEIDDAFADLVREALLGAHREKTDHLATRRQVLARKRSEFEAKLEALWEDRLKGKVSDPMYDRMKAKCETELERVTEEEAGLRTTNADFLQTGERLLELCKGVAGAWDARPGLEKASLLKILCSNLTTDGVTLRADYRRPFDLLAERPADWKWLPG